MKHIIIYILFVVSAALILLNRYTALYVSDYRLHFVLLFVAASTFVITVGHLFNRLKSNKSMAIAIVVVGLLCFAKGFFSWGGDWTTETVAYQNIENDHKTIDVQLRGDRFAFGYKKRVVEVYRLAPGFWWTTDVDTLDLDAGQWRKVGLVVVNPNLR